MTQKMKKSNGCSPLRPSRPVEFGVIGVVVFWVYLVLRDTQGVADFTVSNGFEMINKNSFFVVEYCPKGVADMKIITKTAILKKIIEKYSILCYN